MLLHDLILNSARAHGAKRALLRGEKVLDYTALGEELHTTAQGLVALGLRPGERVAIYLNKRTEAVVAFFASSMAGGVFVPVNPLLKAAQAQHILNDCNVAALVTSATQAAALQDVLHNCPALRYIITVDEALPVVQMPHYVEQLSWAELGGLTNSERTFARRIDNDMAAILYTSGSTGKPKGVVLSHRNMVAGALSVAEYLENSADDVILAALPFSFDVGFNQITTAFSVGATLVLLDYLLPGDVLKAVDRYHVTGLTGVPSLWVKLAPMRWPASTVKRLRYIANTGGAMPTATLNALRERLPNTSVYLMYGLTEAFRSTYLPPEELDARPNSIGKAVPNAEVMVIGEDGTPAAPGEPGELVHRGAFVSLGYWNDPDSSALRFRPAPGQPHGVPFPEIAVWSGDTVVTDKDGFLYFVERKDDTIKSSGYRISPTELEDVIYDTGLVIECAALGIPHGKLGQAIVLAARSHTPDVETQGAILSACKKALPNYMVPSMIVWRELIPLNPNGKIDRNRLVSELQNLFEDGK